MEEGQTEPGYEKGTGYEDVCLSSGFSVGSCIFGRKLPCHQLAIGNLFFADVTTGCPDDVS